MTPFNLPPGVTLGDIDPPDVCPRCEGYGSVTCIRHTPIKQCPFCGLAVDFDEVCTPPVDYCHHVETFPATLEDIMNGKVAVEVEVTCPRCGGYGVDNTRAAL